MTRLEPAEAYRLWAPEYDATPNPLLALEERAIGGMLRRAASGLVLDVGCGTGRWERVLRPGRYFGVDMCPQMLRGTRCAAGDALALPVADEAADLTRAQLHDFLLRQTRADAGAWLARRAQTGPSTPERIRSEPPFGAENPQSPRRARGVIPCGAPASAGRR